MSHYAGQTSAGEEEEDQRDMDQRMSSGMVPTQYHCSRINNGCSGAHWGPVNWYKNRVSLRSRSDPSSRREGKTGGMAKTDLALHQLGFFLSQTDTEEAGHFIANESLSISIALCTCCIRPMDTLLWVEMMFTIQVDLCLIRWCLDLSTMEQWPLHCHLVLWGPS